ncbi:MAG: PAS domain-containing protein, partial [Hymenobacter sp.]
MPSPNLASDPAARLAWLEAELRQARAEAAAARRQLGALTTHLREGLVLLDAEQRIVLLNEQVCTYFGLPRPASQWEGQPIAVLFHLTRQQLADPTAYDDNITHLRNRLAAGDTADTSYLQLLTGRVLEREIMRVRLDDGPGWLFTYRDVTDRCRAERQRDEQRNFYETVLDELPVEVVVLDQDFRYVYANPQAVPDPEQRAWLLSGHTVLEFCQRYGFPLALAEHRRRMFAKAQVSPEPVFWDDRTPQPGGDLVHQRQFKLLSGAGQPGRPYMLGSGLDVTARVRAEEQSQRSDAARREQQQFTEQVLDTLPNALFVRDETGQLTFSNFRMAELATRLRDPAAQA